MIGFDLAGIAVSSGSACSSGKVQPSHVLAGMGVGPELAQGAVRLSLGWSTTEADIDRLLRGLAKARPVPYLKEATKHGLNGSKPGDFCSQYRKQN